MLEPTAPEASKLFFGNSYMSTVIIEIAGSEGETFSMKQISDAIGIYPSIVNALIHKLRDCDFIELVGRVPGEKTQLYRVRDNYWWDAARRYAMERESSRDALQTRNSR